MLLTEGQSYLKYSGLHMAVKSSVYCFFRTKCISDVINATTDSFKEGPGPLMNFGD